MYCEPTLMYLRHSVEKDEKTREPKEQCKRTERRKSARKREEKRRRRKTRAWIPYPSWRPTKASELRVGREKR